MPLRYYQDECLAEIRRAESEGCMDQLLVLPCGTGKTKIASNVPEAVSLSPFDVMVFLVGAEELAFQAQADLTSANPELRVGLEKAEYSTDLDADLIVASVDTLATSDRRLDALARLPIRIVFVDEAHGAVSDKWLRVLERLRVDKGAANRDPNRLHIGLTATPRRFDGVALSRLYSNIVYRRDIRWAVGEGWNAEPIAYRVNTDIDLNDVTRRGADFAPGELSRRINTPELNALVVQKYREYGDGLPFIEFTVDIDHSEEAARVFKHHGIGCEAISSRTPKKLRRELIEAHRNGELDGLASCQALMVGFDSPRATVALWNRPTESPLFYIQGVGRVMRPFPAPEVAATHTGYVKKNAIIVDFVGATAKHRIYTAATMFGLNQQFDMAGRAIVKTVEELEEIQAQNPTLDLTDFLSLDEIKAAATTVNLWKPAPIPTLAKTHSQFTWHAAGPDHYRLALPDKTAVHILQDHLGQMEVWRQSNGTREGYMRWEQPEDAFAYGDSLVPQEAVIITRAKARWRRDPPSEAQCEKLWRKDPVVKNQFNNPKAFWHFATSQHDKGNMAFSKGGISQRIEMAVWAKQQQKVSA